MDVIKVDTRRDTPARIAEILCDACGAGTDGDTAAAVLAYASDNFDVRDWDGVPLSLARYADDIAAVLGVSRYAGLPVVDLCGYVRDDVAVNMRAAWDIARDYYNVSLYVCEKTGGVYLSLPGTFIRTAWRDNDSYGAIGLANRRVYWGDVYGAADMPGDWSDWVDRCRDSAGSGHVVRVRGGGASGYGLIGMDYAAFDIPLVLVEHAYGGSEYAVRLDCWDMVADSVNAQVEYASLSDDWAGQVEHGYVWSYIDSVLVDIGRSEGVSLDEISDFCFEAVGVLDDLDAAYRFEVASDLSVDDSRALNRDGWRDALHLMAIAWVRGGVTRGGVVAAARWAGAEDGDGLYFADDSDFGTAWGPRGARDSATPDWFTGDESLTALLED